MGQSGSEISRPSKNRIALGVCGGIAAYKAVEVLRGLQQAGCTVRVAMTKRACEFIQPLTFRAISGQHVVVDDYAPDNPDPIAHITFSQTVDLLLVVPATANIIAKFAQGIADDFLTSTYLACSAPVLIAPAMNTLMWQHPATKRNLAQLRSDNVSILEPDTGEMACGTFGPGRLSQPEQIVAAALAILGREVGSPDLTGERVLITAGATRELIDPVRFISNRSSGRMGFSLAQAAKERGAEVIVIAGVTTVPSPAGIQVVNVETAEEMANAVAQQLATTSIFIGAAAVADYRPAERADRKIKKTKDSLIISLERTPDILSHVSGSRPDGTLVIGFAAETENVAENARQKLRSKGADMIVANDVSRRDAGFDSDNNVVSIFTRADDEPTELPLMSKQSVAHSILDKIVELRNSQRSKHVTG